MKNNSKLLLVAIVLLSALLACSTAEISDEPQTITVEERVVFQDDFSDPSSGWDRVNNEEGITDYVNGGYRFLVNVPQVDYWANPGFNYRNVVIEVDATKVGGPDDNDFGIICRYQPTANFYFFLVSSDGFYAIGKMEEGETIYIEPDQMYPSDVVFQGEVINHLRAECIGSRLALIVNGELVVETEDSTFQEGDVGLIAGTFDEPGTDIRFDNFVIKEP